MTTLSVDVLELSRTLKPRPRHVQASEVVLQCIGILLPPNCRQQRCKNFRETVCARECKRSQESRTSQGLSFCIASHAVVSVNRRVTIEGRWDDALWELEAGSWLLGPKEGCSGPCQGASRDARHPCFNPRSFRWKGAVFSMFNIFFLAVFYWDLSQMPQVL